MNTITFAVGFLLVCSAVNAQTCLCVEAEAGSTCNVVKQNDDGGCESVTQACQGCVCDLAGTKTCQTATRDTLIVGPDNVCETVPSQVVLCPSGDEPVQEAEQVPSEQEETQAPSGPGTITTSCTVSGTASTTYSCQLACFDERIGTLTGLSMAYEASYNGFYRMTNNADGPATDISIAQTALLEATGETDESIFFFEISDILLKSESGIRLEAGETISEDTSAFVEGDDSFNVRSDEAQYLLCSSNNDRAGLEDQAALTIIGLLSTVSPGTVSTVTQGTMEATFTVVYSYE